MNSFPNPTFALLAAFLWCAILACNAGQQPEAQVSNGPEFATDQIKTSFTEIMAIHDEVMPFIGSMKKDKKQLVALKENGNPTPAEMAQIDEAIDLLEKGDSLMFAWMQSFRTPDNQSPEAEVLPYLAQEKTKIEEVNSTIKIAMKKSKELLEKTTGE